MQDHFFRSELNKGVVCGQWAGGQDVTLNILLQELDINPRALGSIYLTAAVSIERYFTVCQPYYTVKLATEHFLESFGKLFSSVFQILVFVTLHSSHCYFLCRIQRTKVL